MQIIIDIPEEAYIRAKDNTFDVKYSPYDLLDIIKNGTPLDKVIEDIKAEIQAIDITMGTSDYPFIPRERVLEIIERHIGKEKE